MRPLPTNADPFHLRPRRGVFLWVVVLVLATPGTLTAVAAWRSRADVTVVSLCSPHLSGSALVTPAHVTVVVLPWADFCPTREDVRVVDEPPVTAFTRTVDRAAERQVRSGCYAGTPGSFHSAGFAYARGAPPIAPISRRTPASKTSATIVAPTGVVVAALLGPAVFVLVVDRGRVRRRNRWVQADRCPSCGYDVHASAGRCPECGTLPADVQAVLQSLPPTRPEDNRPRWHARRSGGRGARQARGTK